MPSRSISYLEGKAFSNQRWQTWQSGSYTNKIAGALWYKTILKDAVCPINPSNPYSVKPDGWDAGNDNLNWGIVVPSGESYSVRLISNGVVLNTVPLTAGLNKGAQPGVTPGPQRMELIDSSGSVVLAATGGRCVSGGCPDCIYNMNYQVVELKEDTGDAGICPYRACTKQVFAHYCKQSFSSLPNYSNEFKRNICSGIVFCTRCRQDHLTH